MYANSEARTLHPYEQAMLELLNTENYTSLVDIFDETIRNYPGRVAYTDLGQDLSFAEIERDSRAFACYLLNQFGLSKADRLAIQLPNIGQYPIVACGALRAGVVIVNTNPLYTPREGSELSVMPSLRGESREASHELRDPYLFVDADGRRYLY